jgi:hypothetical protein
MSRSGQHLGFGPYDYDCPEAGDGAWRARIVRCPDAAPEAEEVTVAKFSTGTSFEFTPRKMLPVVRS